MLLSKQYRCIQSQGGVCIDEFMYIVAIKEVVGVDLSYTNILEFPPKSKMVAY